jgi:hypothetical protein
MFYYGTQLREELSESINEADGINAQEKMLQQNKTDYDTVLSDAERSIEPFQRLYEGIVEFLKEKAKWYERPLVQSDAEEAERSADLAKRNMNR